MNDHKYKKILFLVILYIPITIFCQEKLVILHNIQFPADSVEQTVKWEISSGSLNSPALYEETHRVSPGVSNTSTNRLGITIPPSSINSYDSIYYGKIYLNNSPHSLFKFHRNALETLLELNSMAFTLPDENKEVFLRSISTHLPFNNEEDCGYYIHYEGWFYPTVRIGSQCWLAENLNVGTRIETIDSLRKPNHQGTDCVNIKKYCFSNDERNCDVYGGLYQFSQAMCGQTDEKSRGICPEGWHIPSHDEWTILERFVCNELGNSDCEKKFMLQSEETLFYRFEDQYRGTNEAAYLRSTHGWGNIEYKDDPFRFSAKPALLSWGNGTFRNPLDDYLVTFFHSSTIDDSGYHPYQRSISSRWGKIFRCTCKSISGVSVRCVKDDADKE